MTEFDIIGREIKRQYEIAIRIDESYDTKTSIVLGFIILVIVQMLNNNSVKMLKESTASLCIFLIGLLLLIYSGYCGIRAYFVRKHKIGANVKDLLESYEEQEERNYRQVIAGAIFSALKENQNISEDKRKHIKRMFVTFVVSSLAVIASFVPVILK